MTTDVVREDVLNKLGEEFSEQIRRGEDTSIEEYTRRFPPEQRQEVADFLESIAMLEGLKSSNDAPLTDTDQIPAQFGRYQIERSLGEGGMGAVYLAHDSQLDRKVALKTPKFSRTSDPNLVQRFYREARSAATLQHPNICPVYDVGELDGRHYISMAYIEGRPLSDYISSTNPAPIGSALRIVRKVALALHEAHQQGLVHRDLKPANIMISRRNEPVVMDFGLARQFDSDEPATEEPSNQTSISKISSVEARLTLDGTVVGSPGYMSPEQLLGSHAKIGPASDVYALGVVLFELLTGRLPFPGNGSLMSIVNAVMSDDPPDASTLRKEVPAKVSAICCRAMAKKIEDRFESMHMLAVALTTALKSDNEEGGTTVSEVNDAPTSPELVRIREQYELARSLYQEEQYAAAVSILEKMLAAAGQISNQYTRWADAQLPKARAKAAKAEASAAMDDDFWNVDAAHTELDTKDYGAASTRRTKKKSHRRRNSLTTSRLILLTVLTAVLVGGSLFARRLWNRGRNLPLAANPESVPTSGQTDNEGNATNPPSALPDDVVDTSAQGPGQTNSTNNRPRGDFRPRQNGNALRVPPGERLWQLDLNGDNKLSRSELNVPRGPQMGILKRVLEEFDRYDEPPRDGLLDHAEVQKLMKVMSRFRPGERNR